MDHEAYFRAIDHFNAAEFFEAHEVWEDLWREASQPEKRFLQGLIQAAVALHHHSTGNVAGAKSLLLRACKNLEGYPENFLGIQVKDFLRSLEAWQRSFSENISVPPFLKVKLSAKD